MRFNCDHDGSIAHARKENWHRWFAWYPVYCLAPGKCVWLETIERKGTFHCNWVWQDAWWTWEYRA